MRFFSTIMLGVGLVAAVAGCRPQRSETAGGMAAVVTDSTLDGAFTAAKQDGKAVVAIFSAPSWCHWCVKLDQETLTDARVQQELKGFHVVFVDFDKEKGLASKYQVGGVPTTILFDTSGKKVHEIVGFREPAAFLGEINTGLGRAA